MKKSKDPLADQAFTSKREALRASSILGCSGAHETEDGWMPCASTEALTALIEGGVDAYRALGEKGLVKRGVRKIRHANFDPRARDADGDGLIQEGTTAERPAKGKVEKVSRVRTTASVKGKPRLAPVKLETHDSPVAARHQRRVKAMLQELDDQIRELGGLGRPRTKDEGPLSEATDRAAEIRSQIETDFGALETLEDYQSALGKVFPNATIDFGKMFRNVDESNRRTVVEKGPNSADLPPEKPLNAFGAPHDDLLPGLKGFFDAVLFKGTNDPESAKLVGAVQLLDPDARATAQVGYSVGLPLKTPFILQVNPRRITRADAINDEVALQLGLMYANDLVDKNQIKKTGLGNWSMGEGAIINSDPELSGMWTGFHEWTHMKGMALTYKDFSSEFIASLQEWVKAGGDAPWLPDYPYLAAADRIGREVALVASRIDPLMKSNLSEIQLWFKNMGFGDVDMQNPAQVAGVYRAIAVRLEIGQGMLDALHQRSERMKEESWGKIDGVSGYANVNPEEGIAEFLAFAEIAPEIAIKLMPEGFKLPEVQERLS